MITGREKLQINSDNCGLGVPSASWQKALETAKLDTAVNIRHAAIEGNEQYRTHVAAITDQVGCHFHKLEDEDYAVVSGEGTLHWGEVFGNSKEGLRVEWEKPVDVSTGDSFVIPKGYAHQLRKRGEDDALIIIFGCPDTNIDDKVDRTLLPDAPLNISRQPIKPRGMEIG